MIKVFSKVKLNKAAITQLNQNAIKALKLTGEALHTEIVQAQVVPRRDGTLQGEAFFMDTSESACGKVTLVHNTPYARRLYFHPEYDFHTGPWVDSSGKSHDGNPNAKGLWFEDWEPGGKYEEFVLRTYAEIYRGLSNL